MRQTYQATMAGVAALACCVLVGCGGYSLAPVSGTVTYKGEPVKGIDIVFYPKSTDTNPNPGPFSRCKLDENGKFELVTRDGETGAVVGEHRVAFEMEGEIDQETIDEAKGSLEEAQAEGDKEGYQAAKKEYDRLQRKLKNKTMLPAKFMEGTAMVVEVPSGGISDRVIELTEFE